MPRLASLAASLQDGVAAVVAALHPERVAGQVVGRQRDRPVPVTTIVEADGGRGGLLQRAVDEVAGADDRPAVGLVGARDVEVVGCGVDRGLVVERAGDEPLAAGAAPELMVPRLVRVFEPVAMSDW